MKKFLSGLMMVVFLFSVLSYQPAHGQTDYEKYGRIAIALVKEDYPSAPVSEYQYLGRQKLEGDKVKDSFQFKVTEQGKEKSVIVDIVHDIKNKKTLDVSVREAQQ